MLYIVCIYSDILIRVYRIIDRHNIHLTEILLKVALNTLKPNIGTLILKSYFQQYFSYIVADSFTDGRSWII
jgi:hypothetical protein